MVSMIERMKKSKDNREYAACVLLDLSKAFDTINHELLIAKMYAYGFSLDSLKIVHSYLSDRWHRTKIDGSYSTWKMILQGMPQGGPPRGWREGVIGLFWGREGVIAKKNGREGVIEERKA